MDSICMVISLCEDRGQGCGEIWDSSGVMEVDVYSESRPFDRFESWHWLDACTREEVGNTRRSKVGQKLTEESEQRTRRVRKHQGGRQMLLCWSQITICVHARIRFPNQNRYSLSRVQRR